MGWRCTLRELAAAIGADPPDGDASEVAFSGVSTDTRTLHPGEIFFALRGEHFDGNRFVDEALQRGAAAAVCMEAGASGPRLLVDDALTALQRFAAWHRARLHIPVIAITGSCGKTTSKDFIAAVLSAKYAVVKTEGNLNNEIGCPLSLLRLDDHAQAAVIEMGANHTGEIASLCRIARPTESAVTMVAPAHLEGFGSIEGVARAKAEIAEGLPVDGCFYVNADDPWCRWIGDQFPGEKIFFGRAGDVVLKRCLPDAPGQMVLDISPVGALRVPLPAPAHAANVLLAIAVGLRHGIAEFEGPLREACRVSLRFRTLRVGPLHVIDDTYNANPASMAAALEALALRAKGARRIAALGAMLELGEESAAWHRKIGEAAARHGVTHLFARGPNARDMIESARAAGVFHAESIEEHDAIARAVRDVAGPGDFLLLKGSRGMRMERVIDCLRALYGESR